MPLSKTALDDMRNGKIDKEYLGKLLFAWKEVKAINPDASMPEELAQIMLIIIDKTLGSSSWRGYSDDWKEEFKGRAIEHLLKYGHRYKAGKAMDPYNYFATIISNAFIQSWRKCKQYSDHTVRLNDTVIHNNGEYIDKEGVLHMVNLGNCANMTEMGKGASNTYEQDETDDFSE